MKQSFSWISGITLIAFAMNPVGGALAYDSTNSTAAQGAIQTFNPAAFNLSGLTGGLQSQMAACKTSTSLSVVQSALKKSGAGGDCQSLDFSKATTKMDCSMSCPLPISTAKSCGEYFKTTPFNSVNSAGTIQPFKWVGEELDTYKNDRKRLENYLNFQNRYVSQCMDAEKKEVEAQIAEFNCMQKVMDQMSSQAGMMLQQALQQNQQNYGKYVQLEQEVGNQISQFDRILGPEDENLAKAGGAQFGGLLGVQRDLEAKMNKMIDSEQAFKTQVSQIKKDIDSNHQKLETGQAKVMSSCFKGENNLQTSGAYSRTCYKPQMVPSGQKDEKGQPLMVSSGRFIKEPCSATDYIKDLITGKALTTSKGAVIKSQARSDLAASNTTAFDSLMRSMFRDLGDFDEAPEKDKGGSLVSRSGGWNELQKKYQGQIDELSARSGVNLNRELGMIGRHCTNEASNWKKQQVRSADSEFNIRKQDLYSQQNKISSELQKGLGDLNKSYGDVMSVLSGQPVSLNRAKCTTTDLAKMGDCYTQIRAGLQDLLEGNSALSVTGFKIQGGTMIPGMTIPCRGINGCVTTFKQMRTVKMGQLQTARQEKVKFVNDGNAKIQNQLSQFANQLGQVQQSLIAQFGNISAALTKLGVAGPERPNMMKPEALQPSEGADKSPGPFKNPQSMAAVLSGMVQPGGLIDAQDTGLKSALASANTKIEEKKSEAKKNVTTAREVLEKIAGMETSCKADNNPEAWAARGQKSGNGVKNDPEKCAVACQKKLSCNTLPTSNLSGLEEALYGFQFTTENAAAFNGLQNQYNLLKERRDECDNYIGACNVCDESKIEQHNGDKQPDSGGTANSARNG